MAQPNQPRFLSSGEMIMTFEEDKCMTTWKCSCKDGSEIFSNFRDDYGKIMKNRNFKYWVADSEDFIKLDAELGRCESKEEKDAKFLELMSSMTDFSNHFEKQIYIRSIPPSFKKVSNEKASNGNSSNGNSSNGEASNENSDENRVFPDEVLEAIPILLKQQGTPIEADDHRLLNYREQWANPAPHLYKTMKYSEFLRILEEFDIDKSKVKVIQDPCHEISRLRLIKTGLDPIKTFSPDMNLVMDITQAVSMVFQGLVCGVNWVTDQCDVHENCLVGLKTKFLALMKEYMAVEKGTYIAISHVISAILELKKVCQKTYLSPTPPPNYMLKQHPPNQICPMDPYRLVAKHFQLEVYSNFEISRNSRDSIPVWMVRVFMKFGWIQQFFGKDEEKDLQELLINSVLFLVPELWTKKTDYFMKDVLQGSSRFLSTNAS